MHTSALSIGLTPSKGHAFSANHTTPEYRFRQVLYLASKTPVILYDTEAKVAWLVDGASVILHIVRTRFELQPYKTPSYRQPFLVADPRSPDENIAVKTLIANSSLSMSSLNSSIEEGNLVYSHVTDLWAFFEASAAFYKRVTTKSSLPFWKRTLRGFEFMDVVHAKNSISLKQVKLQGAAMGWLDMVSDTNPLIFFAQGYGEVITRENAIPVKHDSLVANLVTLATITRSLGDTSDLSQLPASGVRWHKGRLLFEACTGPGKNCTCGGVHHNTSRLVSNDLQQTFDRVAIFGKFQKRSQRVIPSPAPDSQPRKGPPNEREGPQHNLVDADAPPAEERAETTDQQPQEDHSYDVDSSDELSVKTISFDQEATPSFTSDTTRSDVSKLPNEPPSGFYQLVSLLAYEKDLQPLFEEGCRQLPRERFDKNIALLLLVYSKDLQIEAKGRNFELLEANLVRHRVTDIAQEIRNIHESGSSVEVSWTDQSREEILETLVEHDLEGQKAETWTESSLNVREWEEFDQNFSMQRVESFLIDGTAFANLVDNLRNFLYPSKNGELPLFKHLSGKVVPAPKIEAIPIRRKESIRMRVAANLGEKRPAELSN
jgi:hypothetical protein